MVHGHGTGIRTYVCAGPLLSPYGLGKTEKPIAEVLLPYSIWLSLTMRGQPLPDNIGWGEEWELREGPLAHQQ